MMMQRKRFWFVWNPQGRVPQHKHWSLGAAEQEAERLARINPGAEFIILESRSSFAVNNVVRVEHKDDEPDDEPPF